MTKLGLSGFLMVIAEFLAFEILTLASSYLSPTNLAAQAALASLAVVTFQVPFPISVAGSTRLANLIGAGEAGAAKLCIQVTLMLGCAAGLLNMVLITTLRHYIPILFTDNVDVQAAIVAVLPIFAAFQLFDAGVANVNGVMRGMGRQALGSWVSMCCFYLVRLPPRTCCTEALIRIVGIGCNTGVIGFGIWNWMGPFWAVVGSTRRGRSVCVHKLPNPFFVVLLSLLFGYGAVANEAVCSVTMIDGWFIYSTNWDLVIEAAERRNRIA